MTLGWVIYLVIAAIVGYFFYRFFVKNRSTIEEPAVVSPRMSNSKTKPLEKLSLEPKEKITKPRESGKIRIKPINISGNGEEEKGCLKSKEFLTKLKSVSYVELEMNKLWKDSTVSKLFIEASCIKNLGDFLKAENLDRNTGIDANQEVPEIGGFLMGYFCNQVDGKEYWVALKEFVPIESDTKSALTLEFSTIEIVKNLGDAQDKYPNLALIGWFHTHPGHGLFLSATDLKIHNTFFLEKYQVAMEIDSLTKKLDTGFFTRQESGLVNNSLSNRPEWFSWHSIVELGN
ncbi:MAG: hypothetical protein AAFO07_14380 [Bacteroidota bacterium]